MWNLSSHIHVANVSVLLYHNESLDICEPWEGSFNVIEEVLITVGYAIVLLSSFLGNAFVIAIFHKKYELRTPVNYFIVNMAVSDLFVPLFVLPRRIKEVYLGWSAWPVGGVMGDILCKVVNLADEVSVTVSSQSMVFIAAERFWSIVYPMKSPLITRRTTPTLICFTWIFSFIVFVYYLFAYKLTNEGFCDYELPQIFGNWEDLWRLDRMTLLVTFVVIPFVLMTVFYTAILISLHRKGKIFLHFALEAQLHARIKENRRVALMLVAVEVLFIISWTPYYIYFFIQYYYSGFNMSCDSRKQFYLGVRYLNYIYTAINPLIYYTFSTNYRKGFHELLCYPRSPQVVPVSSQRDMHRSGLVELGIVSKREN